ncbi:hypothetical protein C8Q80DRAFT_942976 [Daedaleopsis nitida]|nr:hypothetical protein C8Q80DRAFT_942976 [Daedaleopsis nitida]
MSQRRSTVQASATIAFIQSLIVHITVVHANAHGIPHNEQENDGDGTLFCQCTEVYDVKPTARTRPDQPLLWQTVLPRR